MSSESADKARRAIDYSGSGRFASQAKINFNPITGLTAADPNSFAALGPDAVKVASQINKLVPSLTSGDFTYGKNRALDYTSGRELRNKFQSLKDAHANDPAWAPFFQAY